MTKHDESIIAASLRLSALLICRAKAEADDEDLHGIDVRIVKQIEAAGPLLDAEARRKGKRSFDVKCATLVLIETMLLICAEAGVDYVPERCKEQAVELYQQIGRVDV